MSAADCKRARKRMQIRYGRATRARSVAEAMAAEKRSADRALSAKMKKK